MEHKPQLRVKWCWTSVRRSSQPRRRGSPNPNAAVSVHATLPRHRCGPSGPRIELLLLVGWSVYSCPWTSHGVQRKKSIGQLPWSLLPSGSRLQRCTTRGEETSLQPALEEPFCRQSASSRRMYRRGPRTRYPGQSISLFGGESGNGKW
jgi:hypothetical protein